MYSGFDPVTGDYKTVFYLSWVKQANYSDAEVQEPLMSDFPMKWQAYIDHKHLTKTRLTYLETPHLNQFFKQEVSK